MSDRSDKPYVPADTSMAELTFKALFLGVIMAVVLGAANAYIGMKAGLTVAATFPAATGACAMHTRPNCGAVERMPSRPDCIHSFKVRSNHSRWAGVRSPSDISSPRPTGIKLKCAKHEAPMSTLNCSMSSTSRKLP